MPHPRSSHSFTKGFNPSGGVSLHLHAIDSPFLSISQHSPKLWIHLDVSQASQNISIIFLLKSAFPSRPNLNKRCHHSPSCSKQRPGNRLDAPCPSAPYPGPVSSSSLEPLSSRSSTHCTPFYLPWPPACLTGATASPPQTPSSHQCTLHTAAGGRILLK